MSDRIKIRKIKHRLNKFFGWRDWAWSPMRKTSYGHYRGMSDSRSREEKRNADERRKDAEL